MAFQPREWQNQCMKRFCEKLEEGATSFVFEACMGAGKSAMAAWIAKVLLTEYEVDHVLALVPWKSIQGDGEKGMLGAFGQLMGLDTRQDFFTLKRRQVRQPCPDLDATVTLYQEVCCQEAIDTVKMWQAAGWKFALICDEIHHTNEINSSWGTYVEEFKQLASYSVFMSGTYFRGDRKPIGCVPLDPDGVPIMDFRFPYATGVKENVVRAVTTRDINATVVLYDKKSDRRFELALNEISNKELSEAKKQVLDPTGECVRHIIETAHHEMGKTRTKFHDAACLFVCRPGGGDNFTREDGGSEAQEDRHVHIIARQITELTGETPTVVTHRDKDAVGKIARFRKSKDPYLVAVNMVSEGCDIPRLRAVAFCRYTTSEMLFRQIVGRALRLHDLEDGTAAQIYLPAFPVLVEFAKTLYTEAQEGVKDRRCKTCGEWPCTCPCDDCGKYPCECENPSTLYPMHEMQLMAIEATPVLDGGHLGTDHVPEKYVGYAIKIGKDVEAHRHSNPVQLGHAIQLALRMQQLDIQQPKKPATPEFNPVVEREKLGRQIRRNVNRLAFNVYQKNFAKTYHAEIEIRFKEKFAVIMDTWGVDKLRQVADHLERRIVEVFRRG